MSIKLFSIGRVPIKIHILTIITIAVIIIFGQFRMLLLSFIALTMHEFCHVFMAKELGVDIIYIEIQPCGMTAAIDKFISINNEFLIALSGPIFSIICGALIVCVEQVTGFQTIVMQEFAAINLTLGMINLIPVMPLDGGRILFSILCKNSKPKTANQICIIVGLIISISALVLSIYGVIKNVVNFTAIIICVLMIMGVLCKLKSVKDENVVAILKKTIALSEGNDIKVNHIALPENATVRYALSKCKADKYNIIEVIDNNMSIISSIDEGTLLRLSSNNRDNTLRDVISKHRN